MSYTGPLKALKRAVVICGSQAALADKIGKTQQDVSYWLKKPKRCPGEHAIAIEKATGGMVSRHELRPDLYPKSGEEAA